MMIALPAFFFLVTTWCCILVAGTKTIGPQQRLQAPGNNNKPQQQQRDLQAANYCVTGYIMDTYCISLQTLLDKPYLISLQYPDQHTLHCIVEILTCVQSGYEVLGPPPSKGANYTRVVKLDYNGNKMALDLARSTGICGSCNPNGTIQQGFRGTVLGVLNAPPGTGPEFPPIMLVQKVVPASVSCSSLLASTPVAPTRKPTPAPTAMKKPTPPTVTIHYRPGQCFSETTKVQEKKKGNISIKDLQIGDHVMDASGKMSRVYTFGHFQPNATVDFVQIHNEGLAQPLEVSADHLLFVHNKTMSATVPASQIAIGDHLLLERGHAVVKVTYIQSVRRTGVYAPLTTSGTILVNGVAASNYVTLKDSNAVLFFGSFSTGLSMHWVSHVFLASYRMLCELNLEICMHETFTTDGIATWMYKPMLASQWYLRQKGFVMAAIGIPLLSIGIFLYALEMTYIHGFWVLVLIVPALAVTRAFPIYPKSKVV